MHAPTPPKLPSPLVRMKHTVVLAGCVALPLLVGGLPGCSGSEADSQVGGSAASTSTGKAGGIQIMVNPPTDGGASNGTGGTTGNTPGPYMLPADFTPATLGGFKLGAAVDGGGMMGAAGASTGTPGSTCGTQILGVVRDFKGANEQGGHPDFEAFQGDGASLGIVKADLGDDQKPVYNGTGPIKDPMYGQQTTTKANFDEWYRATPNVNKPYIVYFYFEPAAGVLTFQSNAFFPLDNAGWGNTPKQQHNFGFTTEVHTKFSYKGKETFSFTGDDDLWVFINKKLALDVGGLHPQVSKSISLDTEAAKLGITVGGTYDLDLFHAERHTSASNFRVDTNLAFTNCGVIVEEPPVK